MYSMADTNETLNNQLGTRLGSSNKAHGKEPRKKHLERTQVEKMINYWKFNLKFPPSLPTHVPAQSDSALIII